MPLAALATLAALAALAASSAASTLRADDSSSLPPLTLVRDVGVSSLGITAAAERLLGVGGSWPKVEEMDSLGLGLRGIV